MAIVIASTTEARLAAYAKAHSAALAIEQLNLVNNPGRLAAANAAASTAIAALAAAGADGSGTTAIVNNGQATVPVKNSAGTSITAAGVATVAAGAITGVALPSTIAGITSGVKVTMPNVTGTYVNGITFTVVAGVITAAVAS